MSDKDVTAREEGRNVVRPEDADYSMMSYDELMGMETFRIEGLTLCSKEDLLGVPHIITKATYWMPKAEQNGMVSIEATVASPQFLERAINRRWCPNIERIDQLLIDPNERIVYNDGGTGVRRQITMLAHNYGAIDVGNEDEQTDARFDAPWPEWENFIDSRYQNKTITAVPCVWRIPNNPSDVEEGFRKMALRVDRGLYVSKYDNEYADDATTFYLR